MPGPHDTYFKKIFRDAENAADFIRNFLQNDVTSALDLDSLTLDESEYADAQMKEHFADVVFRCNYGEKSGQVSICLLFEHKSYFDPFVQFQLLRYMCRIWENDRSKDIPEKLTPIIPIVIYHGKEAWKIKSFNHIFKFQDKTTRHFIPEINYLFSNLNDWSDKQILTLDTGLIKHAALALIHSRSLGNTIDKCLKILKIRDSLYYQNPERAKYFIRTTFVYLLKTKQESEDIIMKTIEHIQEDTSQEVMTAYDHIILKGEKRGIEKGIEKGNKMQAATFILNGLKMGLDLPALAKLTELSESEIQQIIKEQA